MKNRIRWSPRTTLEPPSSCETTFFDPQAGYPNKSITPPIPKKLTDPDYSASYADKESMAEFIHSLGPWGWFCLLTFKHNVLEKTAHHRFMRWIRGINEELYGRRFREKGLSVIFVRATERHRNGRIHYHVLISEEVRRLRRLSYKDYWEYGFVKKNSRSGFLEVSAEPGNGFARIHDYDPRKAGLAEKYLVKYMTKEGDIFVYRPVGRPDTKKTSK